MLNSSYDFAMKIYNIITQNSGNAMKALLAEVEGYRDPAQAISDGFTAMLREGLGRYYEIALQCLNTEDPSLLRDWRKIAPPSNSEEIYDQFIRALKTANDIRNFLHDEFGLNKKIPISGSRDYSAEEIAEELHAIMSEISRGDFIRIVDLVDDREILLGCLLGQMVDSYKVSDEDSEYGKSLQENLDIGVTIQQICELLKPLPGMLKRVFENTFYDDDDFQIKMLYVLKDDAESKNVFCEVAGLDKDKIVELVETAAAEAKNSREDSSDEAQFLSLNALEQIIESYAELEAELQSQAKPHNLPIEEDLMSLFTQAGCLLLIRFNQQEYVNVRYDISTRPPLASVVGHMQVDRTSSHLTWADKRLAKVLTMQGQAIIVCMPRNDYREFAQEMAETFAKGAQEIAIMIPAGHISRLLNDSRASYQISCTHLQS